MIKTSVRIVRWSATRVDKRLSVPDFIVFMGGEHAPAAPAVAGITFSLPRRGRGNLFEFTSRLTRERVALIHLRHGGVGGQYAPI